MRPLWAQTAAGALVVVATVGVVVLPSRLLGSERRTELPLPNAPQPSVIQAHPVRVPARKPHLTIAPVVVAVRQPVQAHITRTKPAPTIETSFVVRRTTAPRHVGQPKVATAPKPAVTTPAPPTTTAPAPTTPAPTPTTPTPTTPTVTTTPAPTPAPPADTTTQKHDQHGNKHNHHDGGPNPPSPPQQLASPQQPATPAPTPALPTDPGNGPGDDTHGGHGQNGGGGDAPPHGHDHHK